jgi:hypothetical protein
MPVTLVHVVVLPSAADIAIGSNPKYLHLVRIPGDRNERRTRSDRIRRCNGERLMPGTVFHIVVSPSAADVAIGSNPKDFLMVRIPGDRY